MRPHRAAAPVRIGHVSDLDRFVTDAAPPEPPRRICEEHGVAVEVAAEG